MTSDPAGLDCTVVNGIPDGMCSQAFGWVDDGSGYLDVTLIFTPRSDSYACLPGALGEACYGLGETRYYGTSVYDGLSLDVTAGFKLGSTATLQIVFWGDGSGRVTSSPPGIDCRRSGGVTSGTCSHAFAAASSLVTVSLTSTPAADSMACSMAGCAEVGSPVTRSASMPNGCACKLDLGFALGHPIVTTTVVGSGTVTSSPAGIACPSDCSQYFAPNSTVTLTAKAKAGFALSSWTGICAGQGATCTLHLGSTDASTAATFQSAATPNPSAPPTTAPTRAPSATAPPLPVGASSAPTTPATVPGTSPGPTTGASTEPGASAIAAAGTAGAAPSGPAGVITGPPSSPQPGAAADPSAGGLDLQLLIAVGLALLIGLGIGFFSRSRGRRSPGPEGST